MQQILPVLLAAFVAAPALAQDEQQRAAAVMLPMLLEVIQDGDAQIVATCAAAVATPEERATIAAASGPSPTLGPMVSAILARPEAESCIRAAKGL